MKAAEAVAQILARTGESKSSLSAKSGVSRSLIDDYLKGRRQPSVAQLERLGKAVDLRLDIVWTEPDIRPTPKWARPNPAMDPPALTVAERAKALEAVVAAAVTQQRRPRGELEFPPFRTLRSS